MSKRRSANVSDKANLVKSINIIEKRLFNVSKTHDSLDIIGLTLNKPDTDQEEASYRNSVISFEEEAHFPLKSVCMYFKLLGEAYKKLINRSEAANARDTNSLNSSNKERSAELNSKIAHRKAVVLEYKRRYVKSIKSAYILSLKCLESSSYLRLQCTYLYCELLQDIYGDYMKASRIAERVFVVASDIAIGALDHYTILILQRIRGDFGTKPLGHESIVYLTDHDLALSKSDTSNSENPVISLWQAFDKDYIDLLHQDDHDAEIDDHELIVKSRKKKYYKYSLADKQTDAASRLVAKLRKELLSILSNPVLLDTLSGGAVEMLVALDRIFKVYTRGYALAGHKLGGGLIEMDGRAMPYLSFILKGPYLSWSGFLCILHDFGIASVTQRNIPQQKRITDALTEFLAIKAVSDETSPPLSLKEAAALFIESSRSSNPALTMMKFLKEYDEISNTQEEDPWVDVYSWAASDDWDIKTGLNFMQFIDCIGKCGIIAYSEERFRTIFATPSDRIKHFLSAHMGLSDRRKWNYKVELKLKHMRSVVSSFLKSKPVHLSHSNR